MKRIPTLAAFLALMILATACRQPPTPPQPNMTQAPSSANGSGNYGSNNLGTLATNLEIAPSTGLEERAAGFDGINDANRLEGILPSVYFDFDQSALRPQDRPLIQQAADYLLDNSGAKLLVEGHCDWRGTTEYNMALGERRAANAREYLLSLGIDPNRVEIVTLGDRASTQSSDGNMLQRDRRADLVIIY
jgi:peptidoglycan-associated lipoprotein|tara:strand:+ start:3516 stop:4088 length:573 start_codon:yes stop_codon:yes gene_type:complete